MLGLGCTDTHTPATTPSPAATQPYFAILSTMPGRKQQICTLQCNIALHILQVYNLVWSAAMLGIALHN